MRTLACSALVLLAACSSSAPPAAPKTDPQIAELRQSMTELLERLDVLNDRIARLEEQQAAVAQKPTPDVATGSTPSHDGLKPVTTSPALVNAQIATAYRDAIVLFGRNQIADSRAAFQKVFDADPHGELADNALFWIGETYYNAGQYGEAIRYYARVARDYSDQNKAPDAMYKLALAYEKTSDLTLAKQTLEEVIARYPYSSPAAAAKAELKRIKY